MVPSIAHLSLHKFKFQLLLVSWVNLCQALHPSIQLLFQLFSRQLLQVFSGHYLYEKLVYVAKIDFSEGSHLLNLFYFHLSCLLSDAQLLHSLFAQQCNTLNVFLGYFL